ncbi:MAG: hypothetical protein M1825_000050 [Sarcosagium campestre]|nr:MAG: hypothetical protein M1825_000050 [Sarcosagium campestre]
MRLLLPSSLHYPITITNLLKQPDENVDRLAPLFDYFYKTTVTEGDEFGEEHEVEKTFPSSYESPVEGILKEWKVAEGATISSNRLEIAEIEEPCSHAVQFGGMCTICGKDMTTITYNTDVNNAERATINMIHDNNALTVSEEEASRVEEEAKRRLLKSKKLSLVVDLDQTIIHATVDPTVAEWQKDENNPNHEAVKHVRAFQLVDEAPGGRGCWYYIKLRPGLKDFLASVSRIYELHIYTMGTRAYAQNIATIVDPERKIFGDRILSRDESGSLVAKNLQRLFPVDTKMVVIIDDRGDVWKWNDNLLRVTPYDFFVGIGDINSSFLAKREDIQSSPPQPALTDKADADTTMTEADESRATEDTSEDGASEPVRSQISQTNSEESLPSSAKSDESALEQLVSMGGGDDPTVLQQQAERQDEALAAQLEDRPLLQKQKQLDAEDSASEAQDETSGGGAAGAEESESSRHRPNLLQDDDTELLYLERSLTEVHRTFYDEYERQLAKAKGGRVAQLRGSKAGKKMSVNADLDVVPDVASIMPQMKLRVLEGVVLVFSGVVPLGTDIYRADVAVWARSFGAQLYDQVNKRTTHVVAARNRTAKVRQAARRGNIKIVTTHWLFDSISQWRRLDERPYLIPLHPEDRAPSSASAAGGKAGASGSGSAGADPSVGLDEDVAAAAASSEAMLSSSEEELGESDEEGNTIRLTTNFEDPDGVVPEDLTDDHSPIDGFQNYDWQEVQDDLADYLGSENGDDDDDDDDDDEDDGEDEELDINGTDDDVAASSDAESVVSSASASALSADISQESRKRKRSRSSSPATSTNIIVPTSTKNTTPLTAGITADASQTGNDQSSSSLIKSRLAKRQQLARERTSSLKAVATHADDHHGDIADDENNNNNNDDVNRNGGSLPSPAITAADGGGAGADVGLFAEGGEGKSRPDVVGMEESISKDGGANVNTAVVVVNDAKSGLNYDDNDDDDDDDGALERELAAEMEREFDSDRG